jgi:hypothetical protein
MPKGALLHAHLDATVNAPILLKLALEQPLMHIRVAQRLDAHTIASTLPDMSPVPEAESTSVLSLTDESYVPGDWVQMARARRIFASELGGGAGFDDWIIRSMMIRPSEAYGTHNTPAKVGSQNFCSEDARSRCTRFGTSFNPPSLSQEYLSPARESSLVANPTSFRIYSGLPRYPLLISASVSGLR